MNEHEREDVLWAAIESGTLDDAAADTAVASRFAAHQKLESLFKRLGEPSTPDDSLELPTQIGRYQIRSLLGSGSFGLVYLADDPELERSVVIKVPKPEFFSSDSDVERFMSEARAAAVLKHPSIVTVYDVVRDGDRCVIVHEYIEGRDLEEVMESERLDPQKAAKLTADIADALHFAHKEGFVHRDLKPGNIILDKEGRPHVADFGLVVSEESQLLMAGQVAGTPAYMSPEQVRGETHRLDGRTDIWSLGIILYQLLTGRHPFWKGTVEECFDEIQHREPKPPRQIDDQIPVELESICNRALTKDIAARYATAGDMARDLRQAIGQRSGVSGWKMGIAALVTLSVLVVSTWAWFAIGQGPPPVGNGQSSVDLSEIQIRVWQNDRKFDLASAVPLHSSDDLQIVFEVPVGLHPTLFWFDTEGKLHQLEAERVESSSALNRYVWPASGKSNDLSGPAGTELIFVCADREQAPGKADVESLFDGDDPFPPLVAHSILRFDDRAVRLDGLRGPGSQQHDRPTDPVRQRAERLQKALAERYEFVRGVAFPHHEVADAK